jgi:hypothetical protein
VIPVDHDVVRAGVDRVDDRELGRTDVEQRLGVALLRMGGQGVAVDRLDVEALRPDRPERRVDQVARAAPVLFRRLDGRGRRLGRRSVAADRRIGIDRREEVRRAVADGRRRLIADVAGEVATGVAAAVAVLLHRASSLFARGQCPDQTGGRFSVKAAIPSA